MNATTIIAALNVHVGLVLDAHGIDHDGEGERRLTECPVCGHHAARGVVGLNVDTGLWRCYRCKTRGNAYVLLAALEGLDPEHDREKLLARAAELVGDVSPEKIAARQAEAAQARADRERRRAIAIGQMPSRWAAHPERHAGGEAYLRDDRGIDPALLRRAVRYRDTRLGDPALPLRDVKTGDIVGIQSRRTLPGEPRMMTDRYSRVVGSALHGRLADLDEGCDVAVLAEGLVDTMAAIVAWPTCAVYGAPGASEMPAIAAALAPRLVELRGWLLIVPDDDDAGAEGAAGAMAAAVRAGLVLDETLHVVDLGEHHDLADARRAGWRWEWPRRAA